MFHCYSDEIITENYPTMLQISFQNYLENIKQQATLKAHVDLLHVINHPSVTIRIHNLKIITPEASQWNPPEGCTVCTVVTVCGRTIGIYLLPASARTIVYIAVTSEHPILPIVVYS